MTIYNLPDHLNGTRTTLKLNGKRTRTNEDTTRQNTK
jgi:hypothetical protein